MQLDITIRAGEYLFSSNGTLMYRAGWPGFTLRYKMNLYAGNATTPLLLVKKRSSMLSVSFSVIRSDNSEVVVKVINPVQKHLRCIDKNNTYDIYGHKIETCSVYKNNVQVAWWDMKSTPDKKIITDSDADQELIISFYLISQKIIMVTNDGQGVIANMLTNVTEAKAFDTNWQPH